MAEPTRTASDPGALRALAVEAALAAGAELLARFGSAADAHVRSKSSPTDPVSDADLAAQRVIRELLGARRPQDAFLGEEEDADDAGTSGLRWIVDPLDGTVNYLYGIGQWAVSVAVADAQGTIAGVVHAPVTAETFSAARGEQTLHDGRELRWRGDDAPVLSHALVATGFAYDATLRRRQGATVAALLPLVRDIRRAGSAALDLTATAAGRTDAYYERGVRPWDIAAGALICEGVGLRVGMLADGILVAPPALFGALEAIVGDGATA